MNESTSLVKFLRIKMNIIDVALDHLSVTIRTTGVIIIIIIIFITDLRHVAIEFRSDSECRLRRRGLVRGIRFLMSVSLRRRLYFRRYYNHRKYSSHGERTPSPVAVYSRLPSRARPSSRRWTRRRKRRQTRR